jgi:hypothetical protein
VTLRVAALFGSGIEGAVVIDAPFREKAPEENAAQERRAFAELRVYPSLAGRGGRRGPAARSKRSKASP